MHILVDFLAIATREIPLQQAHETVDSDQRRLELVRYGVGETLEFVVFLLELLLEFFTFGNVDHDDQVLWTYLRTVAIDAGYLDTGPDDFAIGFEVTLDQAVIASFALA